MKVANTIVGQLTLATILPSFGSSFNVGSSAAGSVQTIDFERSGELSEAVESDRWSMQQPMGISGQSNLVAPGPMAPDHLIQFIHLPNQKEAKEAIERRRGWFHNLLQGGSEGTWLCYAVPEESPRMKVEPYMYRIICAWGPMVFQGEENPDRILDRKPYCEIEELRGQLKTLKELKSFFEGKVYWRWQPTIDEL